MRSILTGEDTACLLTQCEPEKISQAWMARMSVDVGDEFRKLDLIEYWECTTTGFRWYTPPDAAGDAALYTQLEKFKWYYMPDKWEFSATLDLLRSVSSVLEVGVGEGHFLQLARSKGYSIQGVELNPNGAARARSLGFQVHELMLYELGRQIDQRFDAICSFQVLEHVPNPREFLEGMISVLNPGGKIIISVPNAAVMRKVDPDNQDLLNQPPHHMGHWDEKVFRSLENILPVNITSVHREPLANYHIAGMVNGYLRSLLYPRIGKNASRLLVNRYSTLPLQLLLRAGLKQFFPGHTLLVEISHQPN